MGLSELDDIGEEKKEKANKEEEKKQILGNKEDTSKKEEEGDKKEEKKEEEVQEIVLKVDMHCEACARKVTRALKGFQVYLFSRFNLFISRIFRYRSMCSVMVKLILFHRTFSTKFTFHRTFSTDCFSERCNHNTKLETQVSLNSINTTIKTTTLEIFKTDLIRISANMAGIDLHYNLVTFPGFHSVRKIKFKNQHNP
ncbi:unnamed protein product [Coffea canephora]|uniref:HMA domain-containing protein n=1 Tax=Coffea canephora TaxID=49390 RepID=A0A068U874_COFCA|nr:unnamed protein product [Coffea canephora]